MLPSPNINVSSFSIHTIRVSVKSTITSDSPIGHKDLWTEAVNALRIATHYTIDSESKSAYQLELAVTLIATQNYDLAQLELIKVMLRNPSAQLLPSRTFLASRYLYLPISVGRGALCSTQTILQMKGLMPSLTRLLICHRNLSKLRAYCRE